MDNPEDENFKNYAVDLACFHIAVPDGATEDEVNSFAYSELQKRVKEGDIHITGVDKI